MPGKTGPITGLSSFIEAIQNEQVEKSIQLLISLLNRRQIHGSKACATATVHVLTKVIEQFTAKDTDALLAQVRLVGNRIQAGQPGEFVISNVFRRVRGLIREVSKGNKTEGDDPQNSSETSSAVGIDSSRPDLTPTMSSFIPKGSVQPARLHLAQPDPLDQLELDKLKISSFAIPPARSATTLLGLLAEPNAHESPTSTPKRPATSHGSPQKEEEGLSIADLKLDVAEGLKELLDEIDLAAEQVSEQAINFINNGDSVLILGSSETVNRFLTAAAAKKRKFTVYVLEAEANGVEYTHNMIRTGTKEGIEPSPDGQGPRPLASYGIKVVLLPDSHVFAIMKSITKVLIGPHAVFSNGGFLADTGSSAMALFAMNANVPVLALTGVYKLCPMHPTDTEALITYGGADVLPGDPSQWGDIEVIVPLCDYVEPEKVTLFITNLGGHAPTSMHRIVADHYDKEDMTA